MAFVLPMPIPSIFIISLPILIKSAPKNDVIPVNSIISASALKFVDNPVVTAVATTGD